MRAYSMLLNMYIASVYMQSQLFTTIFNEAVIACKICNYFGFKNACLYDIEHLFIPMWSFTIVTNPVTVCHLVNLLHH